MCHKISALASDIATAVESGPVFPKWINRGNEMVTKLKNNPMRIYCRSPMPWVPDNFVGLVSNIQIFAFRGASFGSMRNSGSIESALVIVGRVMYRNGDLTCQGCYVDSFARRIARVRRSSLGAEAIALCNCADLSLWMRVLLLEMITGRLHKEQVDPITHFMLLVAFGQSPTAEDVYAEVTGPV